LSLVEETAVVSAISAIILAVFAVIQLQHMEKHRNVDVSMRLFEWAETERLRKAFRWIDQKFQFTTNEDYQAWEAKNPEASEYPFEVAAFYEQVGFLIEKKFVDIDVIVDRLGHSIISHWQKLEPWILALREKQGDSEFGAHFQGLHERTAKYLKKH
jgi:hypothetical protein